MTIDTTMLQEVAQALGAKRIGAIQSIQQLWGGYGELLRVELVNCKTPSVIVKYIKLPKPSEHPRGWNSDLGHRRKLHSFQVEVNWYQRYAKRCPAQELPSPVSRACPIPKCLYVAQRAQETILALEDLATLGFDQVIEQADTRHTKTGLRWLAHFHAVHMHAEPEGLWQSGTYWHLDTRPDELAALDDEALKNAATRIDEVLKQCPFQTLVHGDAKLANFLFSDDGNKVAAVDFQYVGKGCGMKDVILLLGSAVPPTDCAARCPEYVDYYFAELESAIAERNAISKKFFVDFEQLESAWRPLYAIAWADFQRFVKGWRPGHWKVHEYSETLTRQALEALQTYPDAP